MTGGTPSLAAIVGVHAVKEALRAGRPLERVILQQGAGGRLREISDLCRRAGVPVRLEPREALERLAPGMVHQGVVAVAAARGYADLDDVLAPLDHPGLVVILDGVEDPHNLGAIIRSAHAAGADALVVPERRAAGLTASASKAAAGALEYLPVSRTVNVNRTIEDLQRRDFWITGLDERAGKPFHEIDYTGPSALVFGAEGRGLHEQTRKKCDFLASIPMAGKIPSLNVSVAAGIVLFEALRQRRAKIEAGSK